MPVGSRTAYALAAAADRLKDAVRFTGVTMPLREDKAEQGAEAATKSHQQPTLPSRAAGGTEAEEEARSIPTA